MLAAGSGAVDCDLTIETFKRIFYALEIEFIGSCITQAYDIGETVEDHYATGEIKNISQNILSA